MKAITKHNIELVMLVEQMCILIIWCKLQKIEVNVKIVEVTLEMLRIM